MTSFSSQLSAEVCVENWCYVGIDDTEHWYFRETLRQYVEKVLTVYAYNREAVTHCCEISPSYWMICVAYEVRCKPDTPDSIRELLQDIVQETSLMDSDCYRHAKWVETYANKNPELHCELGDTESDTPREAEDRVHELWNQNPRF
jgi:hypothetical protein